MDFVFEEYADLILGGISMLFVLGIIVYLFLEGKIGEYLELFTTWIYG